MDSRNFWYMFYGFAAAWLVLFAYVVMLATRESRLKKEIGNLKRMIEDQERK